MPGSGLGQRRPRRTTEHYQNSSSSEIPAGGVACFTMSGTDDGGLVELPADSPSVAVGTQLIAGVATRAVPAGSVGEFVVNGYVAELRVIRGTRSASTDNWAASTPAIAVGDHLNLHTVGNGVSRATAAASGALHPFVALESKASSASTDGTSVSDLVLVNAIKGFVRLM